MKDNESVIAKNNMCPIIYSLWINIWKSGHYMLYSRRFSHAAELSETNVS